MRKMSQKVFQIFKSRFIDQKKNIFDEIDNLTIENASGIFSELLYSKVNSGDVTNIDVILSEVKSRMKSFIIYQLGNNVISSGIGCGYYDISGNKDEKGINHSINEYLFEHCFNPKISENNYKHFLEYLLINLSQAVREFGSVNDTPHISGFTKVLNEERLAAYWREHCSAIKTNEYTKEDKIIYTSNYTVSYTDHLASIYEVLDNLINNESISGRGESN